MKLIRFSVWFCIGLMFAGCAHNRITLKVDIYGEDPQNTVPLSPVRLANLQIALDQAQEEGQSLAEERAALAVKLYDTYAAFYTNISAAVGNMDSAEELERPRLFLTNYINTVRLKHSGLQRAIEEARKALETYAEARANPAKQGNYARAQQQAITRQRLAAVSTALLEMADSWETDFEKSLISSWPKLVRAATPETIKLLTTNKVVGVESLFLTVKKLELEIEKIHRRRTTEVRSAATKFRPEALDGFEKVFANAAGLMMGPGNALLKNHGLGTLGNDAVEALHVYEGVDEDIIRLWADPVWRTLTDPENSWHWRTTFSTNRFYAEGNSSVVIVRDTPVDFRIQKGDNNPSALIQSQLQITRSIADAAISIAGAASGVPVPKLKPKDSEKLPDEPPAEAPADDFPARRAAVDVQSQFRSSLLRTLRVNLQGLRNEFSALDPANLPARTNLLMRLESTLSGPAALLQPPTTE